MLVAKNPNGQRRPVRSPPPSFDVKIVAGRRVIIWHTKDNSSNRLTNSSNRLIEKSDDGDDSGVVSDYDTDRDNRALGSEEAGEGFGQEEQEFDTIDWEEAEQIKREAEEIRRETLDLRKENQYLRRETQNLKRDTLDISINRTETKAGLARWGCF